MSVLVRRLTPPAFGRAQLYGWARSRPAQWTAALAAGASASLGFAPLYWLPLLLAGLAVLLILIARSRAAGSAFLLGWWFGLGHFCVGFSWIAESFANHPDYPDAAGPPAVLALAAGMAIYPALAAAVTRWLGRGGGVVGMLVFAVAWAAAEWLRGHLFTGFPWNPLAAAWAGSAMMMQSLAYIGTYGLSLLTALAGASLALLVPLYGRPARWPVPVGAAVVFVILAGLGAARLPAGATAVVDGVTVRLVQANISQRDKWRDELKRRNFIDYLTLSETAPFPRGRTLVLWPETAVTDFHFDRQPSRRALAARILPSDAVLVTGAPRLVETEGRIKLANSLQAIDSMGRMLALYDKSHLVPFGEFLPLRSLLAPLGLDSLAAGSVDYSPGPGLATLELKGLPSFSPLICYEAIFPAAVTAGERPDFLLNITNDAWFGSSWGPHQHFAQSRMRAVEEGLALVRVAGTGISAVVNPYGVVRVRIPLLTRGTVDSPLPAPIAPPPYATFGDTLFAILLIFLSTLAIIGGKVQQRLRFDPRVQSIGA